MASFSVDQTISSFIALSCMLSFVSTMFTQSQRNISTTVPGNVSTTVPSNFSTPIITTIQTVNSSNLSKTTSMYTPEDTQEYSTFFTIKPSNLSSTTNSSKYLGFIFPVLVVFVTCLIAIGIVIYTMYQNCTQKIIEPKQPELQFDDTLCNETNLRFEYKAIFRVGNPTEGFDMKNGFVDFQILGCKDTPLTSSNRYKLNLLTDSCELHLFIGRPTRMPPITGILARHGDSTGNIILYDYLMVDLNEGKVVDIRQFNQYITKKDVIFRGTIPSWKPKPKSILEEDEEAKQNKFLNSLFDWTQFELLVFTSSTIMLIGFLLMLFEYFNWYSTGRPDDGSLYHSMLNVLYVAPIVSLFVFIIFVIKYVNQKKSSNDITFDQSGSYYSKYFIPSLVFFSGFIGILLIVMSCSISFVKSIYWFGAFCFVSTCVLGLLVLALTYESTKNTPEEDTIKGLNARSRAIHLKKLYQSQNQGVKTTFFLPASVSKKQMPISTFGPKMLNPNNTYQKQNVKQSMPNTSGKKAKENAK